MNKIFAIEDNDTNYLLVEEILSDFNVEMTRAANGKQFYDIIKKPQNKFDLILMDLMLPDTDGIELTKYIINEHIKTPIVFISAYTDKCEDIFDMGIEYFIAKPVMPELLISVVRKYIALETR